MESASAGPGSRRTGFKLSCFSCGRASAGPGSRRTRFKTKHWNPEVPGPGLAEAQRGGRLLEVRE